MDSTRQRFDMKVASKFCSEICVFIAGLLKYCS